MSVERIRDRIEIRITISVFVVMFVLLLTQYPLHQAARWNASTIAGVLIAAGADVNRNTFHWGDTGLIGLARGDKRGIRPTAPLHEAAVNNAKETAEVLLANGANVNIRNDYYWTALHFAAAVNAKETAEVLLANGASVNARTASNWTAHGWTAWDIAVKYGSKEVAEVLRRHGAK